MCLQGRPGVGSIHRFGLDELNFRHSAHLESRFFLSVTGRLRVSGLSKNSQIRLHWIAFFLHANVPLISEDVKSILLFFKYNLLYPNMLAILAPQNHNTARHETEKPYHA